MIFICGSEGGEICQNNKLVQNPSQKRNPDNEPSQKGFDCGYEITNRCIAFGSLMVNSYAQSSSITSEQEKLIIMSIQKISIWYCLI
jgi:hypothetical protein